MTSRTISIVGSLICLGCQTRIVLVPQGDPVLFAKPTRASVYAFDHDGKLVGPSTVKIPAGWYALPKTP